MATHKKTRNDICSELGFAYSTFTDWANGNVYPRIDKIEMLADYFGINKSDLIENKNTDHSSYYLNDEAAALAQEIYERPELRILMDASRNVSKDDIQFVVDMITRMKKDED